MKKAIVLILLCCLILSLPGCAGKPAEASSVSTSVGSESADPGPEPVEEGAVSSAPAEEELPLTAADVQKMAAGATLTEEQLSQTGIDELFCYGEISDQVFARMEGVSFGEGCVTPREELRYVRVLHTGFDGETRIGELVVHESIADDIVDIFYSLYQASYPIEKMLLIDDYGGDDELSMEDNNTSCFNFRPVSGTDHLSQHAYGLAIDVNPLYNPYITANGYEPATAGAYVDRTADIPYKINEEDLCYQLFKQHGFTWGGSWNSVKDYQHFQKAME